VWFAGYIGYYTDLLSVSGTRVRVSGIVFCVIADVRRPVQNQKLNKILDPVPDLPTKDA
jgi:hypothetical protein